MTRTTLYFLFALNLVLLVLNLYFYGHLPISTKLPDGFMALLTAFVALSGVLWQTNRGFKNLLRSQETQATLSRDQTREANRYSRAEQGRQKAEQKLTLLRALVEELKAGNATLVQLGGLCAQLAENYRNVKDPNIVVGVPVLPGFDIVVYKANAEKLDILGAAIGDVMQAYARIATRAFFIVAVLPRRVRLPVI